MTTQRARLVLLAAVAATLLAACIPIGGGGGWPFPTTTTTSSSTPPEEEIPEACADELAAYQAAQAAHAAAVDHYNELVANNADPADIQAAFEAMEAALPAVTSAGFALLACVSENPPADGP